RLLLDGSLHDVGEACRCILRLAIKVLSRACDLLRLTLELGLRIPGDLAETLFDFPAEVLGGSRYAIFVHDVLCYSLSLLRGLNRRPPPRFLVSDTSGCPPSPGKDVRNYEAPRRVHCAG